MGHLTGKPDGKITDADRTFYGNPNPDFTLGININFTYKQFDFSTVLYGVFGNDILNYTRYFQDFWPQFQNAKSAKLLTESWIPADRSLPRAQWTAASAGAYPIACGRVNASCSMNVSRSATACRSARWSCAVRVATR